MTSDTVPVWSGWVTVSSTHHMKVSVMCIHTGSHCPSSPIRDSAQPLMAINYTAGGAKNLTSQMSLCIRPTLHQDSLQDSQALWPRMCVCACVCICNLERACVVTHLCVYLYPYVWGHILALRMHYAASAIVHPYLCICIFMRMFPFVFEFIWVICDHGLSHPLHCCVMHSYLSSRQCCGMHTFHTADIQI